jgi:PIN domain nuclease of toxin-antitoxin system
VKLLLDTQVAIWTTTDDRRLGSAAKHRITRASTIYLSAVSHVEIAIKSTLGKLSVPADLAIQLQEQGLGELPLRAAHAAGIGQFLQLIGHDPFDRILLAQAYIEGLTLLTSDRRLLALNLPFVMDATV